MKNKKTKGLPEAFCFDVIKTDKQDEKTEMRYCVSQWEQFNIKWLAKYYIFPNDEQWNALTKMGKIKLRISMEQEIQRKKDKRVPDDVINKNFLATICKSSKGWNILRKIAMMFEKKKEVIIPFNPRIKGIKGLSGKKPSIRVNVQND
jgi:hypothetical protein